MNEALLLLEEGADAEAIDRAMERFGFPMGPFELFDLVGIDVAAKITSIMGERLGGGDYAISTSADKLMKAGYRGQKNGRGFYFHEEKNGKTKKQDFDDAVYRFFGGTERKSLAEPVVHDRLALMMTNEAVRCLDEGILHSATDGDLGAVFGLGFPPFLGGPFRYVDTRGPSAVLERLEELHEQHGARYAPADGIRTLATDGSTFH
jgi:3-hydroxyacyl-CoA dehydrogenase/enoyl-CoA hydratase/3-hydroxybutyryl-CoA epimerase